MRQPGDASSRAANGRSDWTVGAADTIERVVGEIRDKTAVPLTTVARALVFGLLAAVMGVTVLVLVAVFSVRLVDVYLPGDVWATDLLLGGIFTVLGAFLLRKAVSGRKGSK